MILGARRLFYLCLSTPVIEGLYAVIRNHCRWDNLKLRPRINSQVLGRELISLYLFIHHTERELLRKWRFLLQWHGIGPGGNLGPTVDQELRCSPFLVTILSRHFSPEGLTVIGADYSSPHSLKSAMQSQDVMSSGDAAGTKKIRF
jgi:hypothetical protein